MSKANPALLTKFRRSKSCAPMPQNGPSLPSALLSRGFQPRCNSHLGGRVTIEGRPIRLRPCFSDISVLRDKGREDCLGNCIYDRRDGLELEGRGEGRFSTDAHIKAIHGDYVVTPWCGKFMPALGGKLPIPGRKAMKPRFPTILPESFYYSGTILSLFGGGGRNRTDAYSFCRAVPYHLATPPKPRAA